jgi:glycosyltransferase involved in cell wall biosynthesis
MNRETTLAGNAPAASTPPSRYARDRVGGKPRGIELEASTVRLQYNAAVVEWGLANGERVLAASGQTTQALVWYQLAARILAGGCDPLASGRLEEGLRSIAGRLPRFHWSGDIRRSPRRWLHVIDGALPYGGHTAMARRWIMFDETDSRHSVALISQSMPVPGDLQAAVQAARGEVLVPPPAFSLLERASWLRQAAAERADCVVLHVSASNVIAPVAFGVEGGPPVLLVNAAAHAFWTGGPASDYILNCRGSELEQVWTIRYRGIPRCAVLPIPIPAKGMGFPPTARAQARSLLGLPQDAVVLLSIGTDYKYVRMGGLDFAATAAHILEHCPEAWMIVGGPAHTTRWRELSARVGGRLRALGRLDNVSLCHAAADLYLEGFPFGSTTALLEAGACGLPAVLAPAEAPPPFGTDGVAVDQVLTRAANIDAYVAQVKRLVRDPAERSRIGRMLADAIRQHHSPPGWGRYLDALIARLPPVHSVHPEQVVSPPPGNIARFWAQFRATFDPEPLIPLVALALRAGIRPKIDYRVCAKAGRGNRVRMLGAALLCNVVLPLCPRRMGIMICDELTAHLHFDGQLKRAARQLLRPLSGVRSWWANPGL